MMNFFKLYISFSDNDFIKVDLNKTILHFTSCKSSFGEVQIEISLIHIHIKKHTQMTLQIYVLLKLFFPTLLFMNIFSKSSSLI
jgi:hypothetical protein